MKAKIAMFICFVSAALLVSSYVDWAKFPWPSLTFNEIYFAIKAGL